jgi:hypothetical protein
LKLTTLFHLVPKLIKYYGIFASPPPYIFRARCLIQQTDDCNFTFLLLRARSLRKLNYLSGLYSTHCASVIVTFEAVQVVILNCQLTEACIHLLSHTN